MSNATVALPSASVQTRTLNVGGMVPFTATDFPGQLAAVLFVQGCPWRCGYCHNPHLQARTDNSAIAWPDIMAFLQRRCGLLDGVVFSGGEPTMDPALGSAIKEVKAMGYKTGLHTGGTYPRRLQEILPYMDWIGLDIKAHFEDYEAVTTIANSGVPAAASLKAIIESGVDFECRTTAHPSLIDADQLLSLGQRLAHSGVRHYAVQIFRTQGCIDERLNESGTQLHNWPGTAVEKQLESLFDTFQLRRG